MAVFADITNVESTATPTMASSLGLFETWSSVSVHTKIGAERNDDVTPRPLLIPLGMLKYVLDQMIHLNTYFLQIL